MQDCRQADAAALILNILEVTVSQGLLSGRVKIVPWVILQIVLVVKNYSLNFRATPIQIIFPPTRFLRL